MECCLSHQEQMLENRIKGLDNPHRETHKRVFKILDRIEGLTPSIDIQRALYFTQSMQETEGQHLTLRWAKALYNIAEKIDVFIDEDSLICGRAGAERPLRHSLPRTGRRLSGSGGQRAAHSVRVLPSPSPRRTRISSSTRSRRSGREKPIMKP